MTNPGGRGRGKDFRDGGRGPSEQPRGARRSRDGFGGRSARRDDRGARPAGAGRPRQPWRDEDPAALAERRAERLQDRRDAEQARDAVRRAAAQRPDGGYSLADFDDIPFNPKHRPDAAAPSPERSTEGVRLQKALANAGVASRRVCEDLITQGRVLVNGKKVTELGSRIDPEHDRVVVNGTPVQFDQTKRYLILNKPVGVVSTMRDEQGRPDLRRYTANYPERLYNVGRLDAETSGLLILTNDGELAHILAHPSFGVTKTYVAKVTGRVQPKTIQRLHAGIDLEDGPIKADSAHIIQRGSSAGSTLVELTLHSGRNRIVRRMLDHVGHPVEELVRRSFGPIQLGTMRAGEVRELSREELGKLLKLGRRAEAAAERAEGGERGGGRTGGQRSDRQRSDGDRGGRGGGRGTRERRNDPRYSKERRDDRGAGRDRRDDGRTGGRPEGERSGGGRAAGGRSGGSRRDHRGGGGRR